MNIHVVIGLVVALLFWHIVSPIIDYIGAASDHVGNVGYSQQWSGLEEN